MTRNEMKEWKISHGRYVGGRGSYTKVTAPDGTGDTFFGRLSKTRAIQSALYQRGLRAGLCIDAARAAAGMSELNSDYDLGPDDLIRRSGKVIWP